jgi:hypothetical protein
MYVHMYVFQSDLFVYVRFSLFIRVNVRIPADQKLAQAKWYRDKYNADRKFRHAESDRKSEWLKTEEGKTSNAEASRRSRLKKAAR